jgi:pimeloyl-ACP methyl ester carboxylesterase
MLMIEHLNLRIHGARLHVARTGRGKPLLLLHGWPEFWLTWEPVMARLADRYQLIVPDLRGFGDSDKPMGNFGTDHHVDDLVGLLDALDIGQVGVVGHDVGGAIMQPLARRAASRLKGLFFFDFVYPGIGARMGAPERLREFWYQSFNQLELAVELAGASRASCKAYIGYILRHWCHRKTTFDAVLDEFVDNFMKPGNLAGGFAYYRAANAGRIAMLRGDASPLPPITLPTCVRWAMHDPLFPASWVDRLTETFPDVDVQILPDVGHFPHREDPERAAAEIDGFFTRIGWR